MATHCKRTVIIPGNCPTSDSTFPVYHLESGDLIRIGFEKGTLKKATLEFNNHVVVTYEANDENPPANLGCVTTRELLSEVKTRIQVHGNAFSKNFLSWLTVMLNSPEVDLDYRTVDLEAAKIYLNGLTRNELRDHAFGDMEIGWTDVNDEELAFGCISATYQEVIIRRKPRFGVWEFKGEEALELSKCGKTGVIGRNDTTGPDEFVIGHIEPGLTREAVLKEITREKT